MREFHSEQLITKFKWNIYVDNLAYVFGNLKLEISYNALFNVEQSARPRHQGVY